MITNEKLNEIDGALADDAIAQAIGTEIAACLGLRKKRGLSGVPRYHTTWGSKTEIGLARSVFRIILDKLTV